MIILIIDSLYIFRMKYVQDKTSMIKETEPMIATVSSAISMFVSALYVVLLLAITRTDLKVCDIILDFSVFKFLVILKINWSH